MEGIGTCEPSCIEGLMEILDMEILSVEGCGWVQSVAVIRLLGSLSR